MTIVVIPARGNSRRVPNKNLKMFHGKPIIQYSIEAAQANGWEVIVSTDDQGIANFAESCKADIHFRHWSDPDGDVGTQEVTSRTLERLDPDPEEIVVTLYATTPGVGARTLYEAESDFAHAYRTCTWLIASYPHRMDDCGAFYIGRAQSYLDREPLLVYPTIAYPIKNHIDINTLADWAKYEEMFCGT